MKEKTLLKLSLVCGIVGIISLFLISSNIQITETQLDKIEQSEDTAALISGNVLHIQKLETVTFLQLQQDTITSITLFNSPPDLEEGDYVQIRGKADKDGFIGDEVRIIG